MTLTVTLTLAVPLPLPLILPLPVPHQVFMLLSILATAFCAHFLSPQFLDQLSTTRAADGTEQSKLPRFTLLTAGGFILSAVPPRHPNPRLWPSSLPSPWPSPSPSP